MRNMRTGEMRCLASPRAARREEGVRPPRADLQTDATDEQQRFDVEELRGGVPKAGDQGEDEEVEDEDEQHRLDSEAHRPERLAAGRLKRVAQDWGELACLEKAGTGRPLLNPLRGHSPLLHDSPPS